LAIRGRGRGRGRGFARGVGLGLLPFGYPYYSNYYYDDDCWRLVQVLTPIGPQLRRVWVCD
jgi:hypothetical protein